MSDSSPANPSERLAWLERLEIDSKVKSPLLDAILRGDEAKVTALLDSNDVDAKDLRSREYKNLPTGLTALHLAALFGDDSTVTQLLDMKANPRVTCYCQITSHSVSTKFWMDARPLLLAIGAKRLGIVEQLIKHGSPVTMNDAWPLYSAEWWQLTNRFDWHTAQRILELLVAAGLNINQQAAKIRWSFLHYCVNMEPRSSVGAAEFLRGRQDTIAYLLDHGADPLQKDTFGRTVWVLLEDKMQSARRDVAGGDLQRLRADADGKLQQLIHDAMGQRLADVRHAGGFRGSVQRMALKGQSLDQLPLLLRNGASSLRRFSLGSSSNVSSVTNVTTGA